MDAGTETAPLQVGARFLNYAIQRLLGKGGHAWVYDGYNAFLDHHVAIKILHRPGGVSRDMLRRGQAEAKLLFRLKHENLVEVFDAGLTENGLLYIIMELLRGQSLRETLRERRRLPVQEVLPLFAAIADGVGAAHANKTIHRDLKPENIFILESGAPKILDFGIAKIVDAAGWTTERDIIHGTLLYMSPEQLEGHAATPRSDIYALGLLLYEVLLGKHPCLLANPNPGVRELTRIQMVESPPRLDVLQPDVPAHVARLVERMLAKLPQQRIQSTRELAGALRDAARSLAASSERAQERLPRAENAVTDEARDTDRVDPSTFLTNTAESRGACPRPVVATAGLRDSSLDLERAVMPAPAQPQPARRSSPRLSSAPAAGSGRRSSQDVMSSARTMEPLTTGVERARKIAGEMDETRRLFRRVLLVGMAVGGTASGLALAVLPGAEPEPPAARVASSSPEPAAHVPSNQAAVIAATKPESGAPRTLDTPEPGSPRAGQPQAGTSRGAAPAPTPAASVSLRFSKPAPPPRAAPSVSAKNRSQAARGPSRAASQPAPTAGTTSGPAAPSAPAINEVWVQ